MPRPIPWVYIAHRFRARAARLRARGSPRAIARACAERTADVVGARLTSARLADSRGGSRPVVVGPCLSEVGFELLYWIPMVRRLAQRHGVDPTRVIAVSRGGAQGWYEDVATRYVDVLDLFAPEQYETRLAERRVEAAGQKQTAVAEFDGKILNCVQERLDIDDPIVLHPSLMVTRFRYFWAGEHGPAVVRRNTSFRRLVAPVLDAIELPREFVAVKAYFSSCFPDTESNRTFMVETVKNLAQSSDVVLLPSEFGFDDHVGCEIPELARVWRLDRVTTASNNLAVQTHVVSQAQRLFTTYGGFSYLAPLLDVKAVSFYSEPNFNPRHLEVAQSMTAELDSPGIQVVDVEQARGEALAAGL